MVINTKNRTAQEELMDDFAMEGEILQNALDKIASINQLLGGNTLTLQGVKRLMEGVDLSQKITIVDVGCGNGDMLRTLAIYGEENNLSFQFIGIDANNFTINHAKNLSLHYPNICYRCENIFTDSFRKLKYDIVLCTLTLHHFTDDEIMELMTNFNEKASIGIVVNDLHRSIISYRLFQLLCVVFRLNRMSRQDGSVSILRGFKKQDLVAFSKKLNLKNYSLQWKWAFRYQWVISTK